MAILLWAIIGRHVGAPRDPIANPAPNFLECRYEGARQDAFTPAYRKHNAEEQIGENEIEDAVFKGSQFPMST